MPQIVPLSEPSLETFDKINEILSDAESVQLESENLVYCDKKLDQLVEQLLMEADIQYDRGGYKIMRFFATTPFSLVTPVTFIPVQFLEGKGSLNPRLPTVDPRTDNVVALQTGEAVTNTEDEIVTVAPIMDAIIVGPAEMLANLSNDIGDEWDKYSPQVRDIETLQPRNYVDAEKVAEAYVSPLCWDPFADEHYMF